MRILRHAAGVPIGLPATRWMLALGTWLLRTESELVLKSRRVVPGRLLATGFRFDYPEWEAAAAELVRRSGSRVPQPDDR
jgi:NAD dependent epimerase/dehydratase family enzyme